MSDGDLHKKILFVDDEQHMLAGMKRMLRGMDRPWDVSFVNSGVEALASLDSRPCHILVTDLHMPGMDGATLLQEVGRRHPGVIRIIFSGSTRQDAAVRTAALAHQFLSKPCAPGTLCQAIDRALALRELLAAPALRDLAGQLGELPTLPSVCREIQVELASDSGSLERVGRLIERDPGLTAKVLQMVNSSFFGLSRRVSSPVQAVTLLGADVVRALLLSLHLRANVDQDALQLPTIPALWRHSIATAMTAKAIMVMENRPPRDAGDAFTAGMLHDAGKLLLAAHHTDRYRVVLERSAEEQVPLACVEAQEFGATHAQLGGYLLGLWGLPDGIVEAVAYHHDPARCAVRRFGALTAVHVADSIESPGGRSGNPQNSPIDQAYLQELGMLHRLEAWRQPLQSPITRAGA